MSQGFKPAWLSWLLAGLLLAGCAPPSWRGEGRTWVTQGVRLTVPEPLMATLGQGGGLKVKEGPHSVFSLYLSRCAGEQEARAELAAYQAVDEDWGSTDATAPRSFRDAERTSTSLGPLTHDSLTGLGASLGRPTLFRLGSLTNGRTWLVYHVILQDGGMPSEKLEHERHEAWLAEILSSVRLDS